ncbi:MAG: TA system VapC family ribonuclease toxin [Pyrinomonadaceae bacterium]
MIFPDINLLLYAYNTMFERHGECSAWLESLINGKSTVCFSWHTIMGFIRMSTTPSIFPKPYTSTESLEIASSFLDAKNSMILLPGEEHFRVFSRLVKESGFTGPRLMDAHIAALAIEHGATVASADRDFRAFDGLKLINPLAES